MRREVDIHQVGAVLFTVRLSRLARFYEQVAGMHVVKTAPDHVVLEIGTFRLTVHQIPEQYSKNIVIEFRVHVRRRRSWAGSCMDPTANGVMTEPRYATATIRTAMCFNCFR
jgi:hypothetical protein